MPQESPDFAFPAAELGLRAGPDTHFGHVLPPNNAWRILRSRTGLQCGRSTFYRWVNSGKIRSVRFGARIYIPWNELERIIRVCEGAEG
jgi:excisionase family DNA binding protein